MAYKPLSQTVTNGKDKEIASSDAIFDKIATDIAAIPASANPQLSNLGTTAVNANINMGTNQLRFNAGDRSSSISINALADVATGVNAVTPSNSGTTTINTSASITAVLQIGDVIYLSGLTARARVLTKPSSTQITVSPALGAGGGGSSREIFIEPQLLSVFSGATNKIQIPKTGNQICTADGTAASPAYSFINYTGVGINSTASNSITFSTNGGTTASFSSDGFGRSFFNLAGVELQTWGAAGFRLNGKSLVTTDGSGNIGFLVFDSSNFGPGGCNRFARLELSSKLGVGGGIANGASIGGTFGVQKRPNSVVNSFTSNANNSTEIVHASIGGFSSLADSFGIGDTIQLTGLSTEARINTMTRTTLTVDKPLGDGTNRVVIHKIPIVIIRDANNNVPFEINWNNDTLIDGALTVNESGADKDTRIEGDTDANLVFVDASTDRVGIGTATPAEKLEVNGNIKGGTISFNADANRQATVTNLGFLTATKTHDFGSISHGDEETTTITVTGAVVGDAVFVGAPSAIEANLNWCAYVSAADTVTLRVQNVDSSGSIDPASATWRVTVLKT